MLLSKYNEVFYTNVSEKRPNFGPLSPFQEGMGKISHRSNKVFNSYGFVMRKKLSMYIMMQLDLATLYMSNFFLLCSLLIVKFLSFG